MGEYGKSIEGYTQVKELDPYWDMPKLRIQSVLDTCHKIQSFIAQKGNFKPKRLKELSSKLSGTCALKDLQLGDNPSAYCLIRSHLPNLAIHRPRAAGGRAGLRAERDEHPIVSAP